MTLFVLPCFFLLFCENMFHVFSLRVEMFAFTKLEALSFFHITFYYLYSHFFPTILRFNGFMQDLLFFISFSVINIVEFATVGHNFIFSFRCIVFICLFNIQLIGKSPKKLLQVAATLTHFRPMIDFYTL